MPQNIEPNPASAKKQAECPPGEKREADEFNTRPDLDGKTDSGPEPDVHGRELPPQE